MFRLSTIAILAASILWGGVVTGMDNKSYIDSAAIMSALKEKADSEVTNRIAVDRTVLIGKVITILSDRGNSVETRINAAHVLGIFRASEAVDVLVASIKLAPERFDEKTFEIVCPCGKALVDIGSVAREALIRRLAVVEEQTEREIIVSILIKIDGYLVTEFLLNTQNADSLGSKKVNLNSAMQVLTKLRHERK